MSTRKEIVSGFYDRASGKTVRLSKQTEGLIEKEALAFYKPFPLTRMTMGTLMKYIIQQITPADVVMLVVAMAAVTGIGMLTPRLNNLLFSDVLASGSGLGECICSHAEENSITQAAYHGISTKDATIYVTLSPCLTCAKMIINSGIKEVIYDEEYKFTPQTKDILAQAGVIFRRYKRSGGEGEANP